MRRFACLLVLLALFLGGCFSAGNRFGEPVTFYYLRAEVQYGQADGVIAPERREAAGHQDDLEYLLALYLMGPSGEKLRSPLPRGTTILNAEKDGDTVAIELSDTSAALSDGKFSLACACLAKTCMELTDCAQVKITSGSRSIEMNAENLVLFDTGGEKNLEETQ